MKSYWVVPIHGDVMPVDTDKENKFDNEINLFDIFYILYTSKLTIIGVTVLTISITIIYLLNVNRIYQSTSILTPPSVENIYFLNTMHIQELEPKDIFESFKNSVESRKVRKKFFGKNNLISEYLDADTQNLTVNQIKMGFKQFSKSIKVTAFSEVEMQISIQGEDKDKMGSLLDRFIDFSLMETASDLKKQFNAKVNLEIKNLELEIVAAKALSKKKKAALINTLEKDYKIAKKLGIQKHFFAPNLTSNIVDSSTLKNSELSVMKKISSMLKNSELSVMKKIDVLNASVNAPSSGYLKGTKLLQAEIDVLKERGSYDSYIGDVYVLESSLIKFKAIDFPIQSILPAIVNKKAAGHSVVLWPQKRTIVVKSALVGFALGVLIVLLMQFYRVLKIKITQKKNDDGLH